MESISKQEEEQNQPEELNTEELDTPVLEFDKERVEPYWPSALEATSAALVVVYEMLPDEQKEQISTDMNSIILMQNTFWKVVDENEEDETQTEE